MSHLDDLADDLDRRLRPADAALAARYPGDRGVRQPVHTVYLPADRYHAETVPQWGRQARDVLAGHAPSAAALAAVTGLAVELVDDVLPRVQDKLAREPIEDLRIDFEDGYGSRPDGAGGRRRRSRGTDARRVGPGWHRAPVPRDPLQELRGADPAAGTAHPGPRRG